jgi:squalene monooxygenase
MTSKPSTNDILVIGAGVAGSAIAKALARQGRQVLLIDRSFREPDRIVGELLQPGGVEALSKLGLTHCLEGIEATPVEGYHLYWKDERTTFWFCPATGKDGWKPEGRSFHHGKFVTKLREAAAAESNVTTLEATALEILRDGKSGMVVGALCSEVGGQPQKVGGNVVASSFELLSQFHSKVTFHLTSLQYHALLTILADGSTSNFRSQFTPHRPKAQSRFWGLEMIDANLPFHGYAYGILGFGPPVLIYQIGVRETRILIDIPDKVYRTLGNSKAVRAYIHWRVAPNVPESIRPSLKRAIESGRLRSMPNAWMPSTRNSTPGLIVLGDAANMRHPVTGAGMTVVLKDVILLADMINPTKIPCLKDTDAVLKKMQEFHWKRKAYSASLNILAQALYFLFVSEGSCAATDLWTYSHQSLDDRLDIMQRGFIRYIQEGEKNFAEPACIMGGITDSPLLLFYHFFRIALYSIGLHVRQAGYLGLTGALVQSALVFVSAVGIIWWPLLDELRH